MSVFSDAFVDFSVIKSSAPPVSQEPSEQDRNASIDLSKQPARKPVGDMGKRWCLYKLTLRESMRKAELVILILTYQGGKTLSPLVLWASQAGPQMADHRLPGKIQLGKVPKTSLPGNSPKSSREIYQNWYQVPSQVVPKQTALNMHRSWTQWSKDKSGAERMLPLSEYSSMVQAQLFVPVLIVN